jgi:hypothetical protein
VKPAVEHPQERRSCAEPVQVCIAQVAPLIAGAAVSSRSTFCARCASFSSMGLLLPRQSPPSHRGVVAAAAPGAQAVAAVAIRRESLGGLGPSAVTAALHRKFFCGARRAVEREPKNREPARIDPPPDHGTTLRLSISPPQHFPPSVSSQCSGEVVTAHWCPMSYL